jgi:VIT1/CCC1 family predicted Fe2+/Mn2+ transporter
MTRRQSIELAAIVVVVHLLEDATILSVGRFLPVPIWAVYSIGLGISAVILTGVFQRLMRRWRV